MVEFADKCYVCQQTKHPDDPEQEEESLIVCDDCNYNLVHYACVGFAEVPRGDWFCRSCAEKRRRDQQ